MILKREFSINIRSDQSVSAASWLLAMGAALDDRKHMSTYLGHLYIMRTQVRAFLKLVGRRISEERRRVAIRLKKGKQMAASKTKKPALRQITRPNGAGPSKIWRSGESSRPNGAAHQEGLEQNHLSLWRACE